MINITDFILQILKRDIDIPQVMNIDISEIVDYPPRLSIAAIQTASHFISPKVQVDGLDRECNFNLIPVPCKYNNNVYISVTLTSDVLVARVLIMETIILYIIF